MDGLLHDINHAELFWVTVIFVCRDFFCISHDNFCSMIQPKENPGEQVYTVRVHCRIESYLSAGVKILRRLRSVMEEAG